MRSPEQENDSYEQRFARTRCDMPRHSDTHPAAVTAVSNGIMEHKWLAELWTFTTNAVCRVESDHDHLEHYPASASAQTPK